MRLAIRVIAVSVPLLVGCRDMIGPGGGPQREHFSNLSVAVNLTTAPEVAQVRLHVTAADLADTLWFPLTIQDSIASGTASVPPGPRRTFTLQALDSARVVRYQGSATIDVATGVNAPLTIVMSPVQPPGQVPIIGQIGRYVVIVAPAIDTLNVGQRVRLTASVRDSTGTAVAGAAPTWKSLDTTVAIVDTAGNATARAAGSVKIVATYAGASGSASIVVKTSQVSVSSITVTLNSPTIIAGQSTQAAATLRDSAGNVLTGKTVIWSSSDTTVASVSAAALVSGLRAGTAQIIATSEGKTGSASLTITASAPPPPPSSAPGVVSLNCNPGNAPPVPNTPARSFYVDAQNGNDANAGSLTAPWQTLTKANGAVQAGDYVYLKGTFGSGQWIAPNANGTASAKIVFTVWPGATALLTTGRYGTSVYLASKSHIVIDGLEITANSYPIELLSGSNNIWLRNLYVHDNGSQISLMNSSDNRIEDSRIEKCGSGSTDTGDCLWIADGANRNVITRNTMRYGGHGLISVGGDKTGMAPSVGNVIAGNDLGNVWAQNVGLIGYATNTLVECNRLHDASTSGINYPRGGMIIVASNNVFRYNLVYNNSADGIQIQAYNFQGLLENAMSNQIYNNTVYNNGGAALQLSQQQAGNVANNVIENNIFWNNNAAGANGTGRYYQGSNDVWIDLYNSYTVWPVGSLNGNVISNNILGTASDAGKQWMIVVIANGNRYYTLAQAQSVFGAALLNVTETNPLLNGDLSLQSSSPAIDIGLVLDPTQRFLGVAPDLGALERR